jgi:hypothetical protein
MAARRLRRALEQFLITVIDPFVAGTKREGTRSHSRFSPSGLELERTPTRAHRHNAMQYGRNMGLF